MQNKFFNHTINSRLKFLFVFYLFFFIFGIWVGETSCQGKEEACEDNGEGWTTDKDGECVCADGYEQGLDGEETICVESSPDETTTETDPATVTCTDYISSNFSAYSFSADYCICVGDDTSWCPLGDSATATTERSIADALITRSAIGDTVVMILNEQTFEEAISLTNSSYSNTYFIGKGSESTTIITYPSSSTPNITDHVIEMDSNVSTIGFYHVTINGIGSEVTPLDSVDNLEAATVAITDSTSITFDDVILANNYFRGFYISGNSSTVTLNVYLEDFITGTGDYETAIGVWNEGNLTITNSLFDDTAYVGIISTSTGNQLTVSNLDNLEMQLATILLYDTQTATISSSFFTNSASPIGIYAEDVTTVNLDSSSIEGPSYGFVGCQTNSSASTSSSIFTFTGNDLYHLYFKNVEVGGSGNNFDPDAVYSDGTTDFTGDIDANKTYSKGCDIFEYYEAGAL